MKHSLSLIGVIVMVVACKPTVPSQYIQPDDMEDMLYDYHMAEAIAKNEYGDGETMRRNAYFQAVLEKHHVSEAEFDSSLVYYYSHLDRLKDIYARVNVRITEEAERVGASVGDISHYSQYNASGDTANIWTGRADVLLIPRPTKNRFEFTVKADSTFRKGDSFMFQFMTEYIYQSGTPSPSAFVCICAHYANDSILQVDNRAMASTGISQLRVPANAASDLKELRGFIYLGNDKTTNARPLMFVSQIQLIRFHDTTIQNISHEQTDSLKTDSLQRTDHARRDNASHAGSAPGGGLRSKNAPFRKGGGGN